MFVLGGKADLAILAADVAFDPWTWPHYVLEFRKNVIAAVQRMVFTAKRTDALFAVAVTWTLLLSAATVYIIFAK
jgi:hypothetical protein